MSDLITTSLEIVDLQNKISERQTIIDIFYKCNYLDRDDAINKILELRYSNKEVCEITAGNMLVGGSTKFENCLNSQIVGELQMQVSILQAELIEKLKVEGASHANA